MSSRTPQARPAPVSAQRGLGQTQSFSSRLFEIIELIRSCELERARTQATAICGEAVAACDDEAAGRASSFLGEIAGIRGELEEAMRHFGVAIERLENTDLAGSISRAYRGWAYCYLMFQMPRLALQPAREARRMAELIDVAETHARAEFECAICDGLVNIELMNVDEAEQAWKSAEHLVARMSVVDDWLPGLYNLLGGRVLIEQAKRESDWRRFREGVATLERVIKHFRASGLVFWEARSLEMLGRAQEEDNREAAIRHVREAATRYREIGAAQLLEGAEQWMRSVRPVSLNRYIEAPAIASPNQLLAHVTVVEGQFVAGPKTREIVERAMRYAQLTHPVLIMGESGTGKEGVARIIHTSSARKDGEFVPVNCASLPESLIESMLFGHRKGTFTGATGNHIGLIRQAEGGTLFLDEIGELPLDLQPKLLRFLESGRTLTMGETVERSVDVRIVAATNCNLEEAVSAGRFREDLFYRLNVLRLDTIPLRDRIEEVPRLAQYIANEQGVKLTMGALNALSAYGWPGNVRQLRNVILRATGIAGGHTPVIARQVVEEALAAEHRPAPVARPPSSADVTATPDARLPQTLLEPTRLPHGEPWPFMTADAQLPPGMSLPDAEREFMRFHIARALAKHKGNKTRAARDLGLKLQTLHVRARKLGLA